MGLGALVEVLGRLPLVGLVRLVAAVEDLVQVWLVQAGIRRLGQRRLNVFKSRKELKTRLLLNNASHFELRNLRRRGWRNLRTRPLVTQCAFCYFVTIFKLDVHVISMVLIVKNLSNLLHISYVSTSVWVVSIQTQPSW